MVQGDVRIAENTHSKRRRRHTVWRRCNFSWGAARMHLKDLVRDLADLIWQREQQTEQAVEDSVLTYVHDAVTTELDYRRRMRELDRRLRELAGIPQAATTG